MAKWGGDPQSVPHFGDPPLFRYGSIGGLDWWGFEPLVLVGSKWEPPP